VRLLVVTVYPILPLSHGGRVRTFGLATALARRGVSVDLLCPWAPGLPPRPFVREGVRCVPHFFAANALLTLPDDWLPSVVALSWQPFALGPRRRLRHAADYDVIQFELCAYGAWMERLARVAKVVYSAHNVEADLAGGQRAHTALRRALLRRVAALERRTVRASDLAITCTEADARRLGELYGGEGGFAVIPNGFEDSLLAMDRQQLRPEARASLGISPGERALLFVGGAAPHNRQAVEFLATEVLPRMSASTRLLVVGRCADGLRLDEADGIVRLGHVEDLRPVLAAADVALNPVSYGSGSNLKMAEYLAAGLPVVSTPVGARGFERRSELVRIAELGRFAEAIEGAESLSGPGGVEDLGWSRIGQRLERAYAELLSR
jgi:glycosyltransferase involved in cell wall biosynthesis